MNRLRLVAAVLGTLAATAGYAAPTFVNGLALPGNLLDATGGTSANAGRVGFFSDIYYDRNRNEWWGLSDRGPGGGSISYDTRVQRFTLDINPSTGAISNFQIAQTILFSNAGTALNGLAPAAPGPLGNAFDPEGIVINPKNGNLLVSDEYGPSLYEFNRSGALVRAYNTPANLIPRNGAGDTNFATDTGNTLGKRGNRGFEGLAISPDGNFAYAMLQSPMLDDGGAAQTGSFARIVKFDTTSGDAVAQYAYRMDRPGQGQGISSLVALDDARFLVLERNNRGIGVGATLATADKAVYAIDLTGAEDVSGIQLPATGTTMPPGFDAVAKGTKLIDLDANTLAALGGKSPEKWEGLAVGPQLGDGSYLLLAGTDNDYSVTQNTGGTQFDVYFRFSDADPYATSIQCPLGTTTGCTGAASSVPNDGSYQLLPGVLHAYRATAADLGGYTAPVPEPGTWALMLGGLGLLGVAARRRA
ncbi:MAG: esterase-like activity of phytase family protein [Betaproteobacteria bacterium]